MKVLVSDEIAPEGLELLNANGDFAVIDGTGWQREQLLEHIGEFHGLIVRSRTQVDRELIRKASRLRVIGRAGVGVDNVDLAEATKRGILVTNSPEGNIVSTAEHTIAMMMALARHIPGAHVALARDRKWQRSGFMGVQLSGKKLGVIGLGRVGSEVASRAKALRMDVYAYDPLTNEERAAKMGVHLSTVDDICRQADFITVHTPLTKQTEGLIGPMQFGLMKPGVRIINCARGGIVDEEALLDALLSGTVAGAALDVFQFEPPLSSPLLDLPQVIVTPHLAASTYEAQVNVAVDVVRSVMRALHGEPVKYAVNAPAMRGEGVDGLHAYVQCAEDLGHFFTAIFGGNFDRIEVRYRGEALRFDDEALTSAFLKGVLSPVLHETVNLVNARLLAKERDFRVDVVKESERHGAPGAIQAKATGVDQSRSVTGMVVPGRGTVLTEIDGYPVNVDAVGRLLVAYNIDRPGIIGQVGTLLGRYGVNIASMQVGRKDEPGSYAVMLLGIDDHLTDEVMKELEGLGVLRDIRLVDWNRNGL